MQTITFVPPPPPAVIANNAALTAAGYPQGGGTCPNNGTGVADAQTVLNTTGLQTITATSGASTGTLTGILTTGYPVVLGNGSKVSNSGDNSDRVLTGLPSPAKPLPLP